MREITSGVYVETKYESGNVGLIRTGVGAICVDLPMMPDDVRRWLSHIRKVIDEPIIYLVQTDCDQERVLSTSLLDVPVIAHHAAWEKMKVYSKEKKIQEVKELLGRRAAEQGWQVRMPDITFTEELILSKGTRNVHVVYGGGHSPAACMVHLPQERLLFSGDLLYNGAHPTMDQAETKEWLSVLTQLRKMDVDTIVPGHGSLCDRDATYPLSDYVRDLRARVRRSFQRGRSKSETATTVIPEFLDAFPYDESERDAVRARIKNSVGRIYDEYRAAAKASRSGAGPSGLRKAGGRRRKGR